MTHQRASLRIRCAEFHVMSRIDWDHARIFLAVVRSGQFLAAARALRLDHATVARRIGALEDAIGQPLLVRRTNGVALNAAGERFLQTAERIESDMLGALSDLSEAGIDLSGVVRVAAPDGFGNWFLADRLGALMARHLRLSIQLAPLPRAFSLSKREADLAVMIEPPREARLSVRKLTDYRLRFYASRRYISEHGAPQTLDALKRHVLVTYVQDLQYADALTYFADGYGPDYRRFECASVIGQMEAVKAGRGIGILHDYAARKESDLTPILPAESFTRTYWLVAHLDSRHLARIAAVHDEIVNAIATVAGDFA
jgi:DNA-binding transcriptional LysR family regulator